MRTLLGACFWSMACLLCWVGVRAEPTAGADEVENADAAAVESLIAQLGAEQFSERENATEDLINIGLAARPALEAALEHPDREIRYRSRRVLAIVKEHDFRRRLEAFAANRDSEHDYDLPAWNLFKEQFGSSGEARALFVMMQKAEPAALQAIEESPKAASHVLANRTEQLVQTTRVLRQELPLGTIATMLFLGSDERVSVPAQTSSSIYSLCYQSSFRQAVLEGEQKDFMRKLLGGWIRRGEDLTAYQGIALAMQYDLTEGLIPAVKMLENKVAQTHLRQYAILAVAKFGNESHIPLLEKLLDDKAITSTRKVNNVAYQTQVRDVALAALLKMTGQDPKDYGFDRLQTHPQVVFNTSTIGFENEEKRSAALKKWNAFRAKDK